PGALAVGAERNRFTTTEAGALRSSAASVTASTGGWPSQVDARVGMLAPPRREGAAKHAARLARIGGMGVCCPELRAVVRCVGASLAQVCHEVRRERGRMDDVLGTPAA